MTLRQPRIILASQSPRRRALLQALRVPFRCIVADYVEDNRSSLPPRMLVLRHARAKVMAVAPRVSHGVIVGADTLVAIGKTVFGKPRSRRDAVRMLRTLQGRSHYVYTGVVVLDRVTQRSAMAAVRTRVTMRPLADTDIARYCTLVNPLDKAGGYAIQEAGGIIIARIAGCYYNVLGFPVATLEDLLRSLGYSLMLTPRTRAAR